ncbi:MAG TPA: twin-arginine translocase TatA/TatE family subunit [Terracidiphilus sp.]|nr:twin-arginine translocase TatA/TatE family subunit [Terracidiphilus sp.]
MVAPPQIEVSTLGMADSLILMVLALVVFGPRRLPQIGRQLGKLMYEFRKASNDFKFQMEEELRNAEEADRRKREEEQQKRLTLEAPAEGVSATAAVTAMQEEQSFQLPESVQSEPKIESARNALKIQPPSTGETVAAERPGARIAEEATVQAQSSEPQTETFEAQAEEPTEVQAVPGEAQPEPKAETTAQPPAPSTEAVSPNG